MGFKFRDSILSRSFSQENEQVEFSGKMFWVKEAAEPKKESRKVGTLDP